MLDPNHMNNIVSTAQNGTPEQRARLVEYVAMITRAHIYVLRELSADTDAQVANPAMSWLEQLEAMCDTSK